MKAQLNAALEALNEKFSLQLTTENDSNTTLRNTVSNESGGVVSLESEVEGLENNVFMRP